MAAASAWHWNDAIHALGSLTAGMVATVCQPGRVSGRRGRDRRTAEEKARVDRLFEETRVVHRARYQQPSPSLSWQTRRWAKGPSDRKDPTHGDAGADGDDICTGAASLSSGNPTCVARRQVFC